MLRFSEFAHREWLAKVTVGALLTVPGNGKEYSAVATVFAGALQVFATLYVSYKILKTAEEHYQELSQDREEHEQAMSSAIFWGAAFVRLGAAMPSVDEIYVCIGVKASNYFMPADTLSDKGPGGGGWIHFNKHLQVTKKPSLGGQVWADGSIYAVGDCNYGCIGEPGNWEMPPVPKISYPGRWAKVIRWGGI
eukprot:Skav206184  [mRNA]  locus=scaffold1844:86363:95992:- [translate_table: standard]